MDTYQSAESIDHRAAHPAEEYRRWEEALCLRLRLDRPHDSSGRSGQPLNLVDDGERILDLVDGLLKWPRNFEKRVYDALASDLDRVLLLGGSAWSVGSDGLERRVDSTVKAAFTTTLLNADATAGEHLAAAWTAAYGRHPDPDKAYAEAVNAFEALAGPLVSPRNTKPTLGTVIRDLRNQTSRWELSLTDKDGQAAGPERLIEMMALLWEGQSRHAGGSNSRRHQQTEREAAVNLAATLVQWLQADVLRQKP